MAVYRRIKYVSRFSREMGPSEVEALVQHAASKNAGLGITGVLLTTGQLFYQVIEGPSAEVGALFSIIREDVRHTDVLMLSDSQAAHRLFPDWSMRLLDFGPETGERLEPLRAILAAVLDLRLRADLLTNSLESALLLELSRSGG